MIKFRENIELPSDSCRTKFELVDKSMDDSSNVVHYRFIGDADSKIKENLNGFNNKLIQQSAIAIFEYLHPGIVVDEMQALFMQDADDELCPTLVITFRQRTSKLVDMFMNTNTVYMVDDKFQPLHGCIPNIVSTFIDLESSDDQNMITLLKAMKMIDHKDMMDIFNERVDKIDDTALTTLTYMSYAGIAGHIVYVNKIIDTFEKFVGRKIKDTEIDTVVSATISDICNGSISKSLATHAYFIPRITAAIEDGDIVLAIDYTHGVNVLIRNDDCDTSAQISIETMQSCNGSATATVAFTQTDNVMDIPAKTVQKMIHEFLNYQGLMYSSYAEYRIVSSMPAKYVAYSGITPFGTLVGSPLYSVSDKTLPKNRIPYISPCYGTIYSITDFKLCEHFTAVDGVRDTYRIELNILGLVPNDTTKLRFRNRGIKCYSLTNIMAHTCIFKNKKTNVIVTTVNHSSDSIVEAGKYIEGHCKSIKGVSQGHVSTFVQLDEIIVYYIGDE